MSRSASANTVILNGASTPYGGVFLGQNPVIPSGVEGFRRRYIPRSFDRIRPLLDLVDSVV